MSRTRALVIPLSLAVLLAILGGCANDNGQIPPSASVVSSGNDHVTYTAPNDGTVWVYDAGSDRIIYSGALRMNQSISVDVHNNKITIDGRTVYDQGLNGNLHKIYFMSPAQAPAPM
jgi:hypothetical protein